MPCRNPCRLLIHDNFFGPFRRPSPSRSWPPFRPTRDRRMQWPCAFSLVWKAALSTHMVCWNLHETYLLKADLMQKSTTQWNGIYSMPCRNPRRLVIHDKSYGPFLRPSPSRSRPPSFLTNEWLSNATATGPQSLVWWRMALSTTLQRAGTWSPRIRRVIFDFWEGMTLGWLPEGHCWAGDQRELLVLWRHLKLLIKWREDLVTR